MTLLSLDLSLTSSKSSTYCKMTNTMEWDSMCALTNATSTCPVAKTKTLCHYEIPVQLDLSTDGILILGVPIGNESFIASHLASIITELHHLDTCLESLHCAQAELFLWTKCGSTTRITHLLRTLDVQSPAAQNLCLILDMISMSILRRCMKVNLLSVRNAPSLVKMELFIESKILIDI
jgi:hypothetical protein